MLNVYKQYLYFTLSGIYDAIIEMNFFEAKELLQNLIDDMDSDGEAYPLLDLNRIEEELFVENYGYALDMLMSSLLDLEEDLGMNF
jgi:hypothetical protein